MKTQYRAIIVRANGMKENAYSRYNHTIKSKMAPSIEEARKAISYCKNEFKPNKVTVSKVGYLSVESIIDKETCNGLAVVDSYIESRQVTEWERV